VLLFAFAYLMPFAVDSLRRGAAATRFNLNVLKIAPLPGGILTTIAVASASYYSVFSLLLFAALVRRLGRIAVIVTVAGACLPLIHAAVFGARDGVIWTMQALLLALWAVQAVLTPKGRRRVVIALVCVGMISLVYFALATQDRFAETRGGYESGTVAYFGSQPYVFCETVERLTSFYGLGNRFPVAATLFGGETAVRTEPFQWSFGTFLADFYSVAGWSSAIVLSLSFTFLAWGAMRLSMRKSAFAYTVVVAAYSQFMVQGVFYYRLGNIAGNLYHLSLMALVISILVLFPDIPRRKSLARRARLLYGSPGQTENPNRAVVE
jgi:hypothetical protein